MRWKCVAFLCAWAHECAFTDFTECCLTDADRQIITQFCMSSILNMKKRLGSQYIRVEQRTLRWLAEMWLSCHLSCLTVLYVFVHRWTMAQSWGEAGVWCREQQHFIGMCPSLTPGQSALVRTERRRKAWGEMHWCILYKNSWYSCLFKYYCFDLQLRLLPHYHNKNEQIQYVA